MKTEPEIAETEEMRQVIKVLNRFSENERDYFLYQSRLETILKENTCLSDIEEALREKEQAQKEKEQAEERIKSLLLLLEKKGIDPDKDM